MRATGFGVTFLTAISVSLVAFVCYVFVDNTDLVHTAQYVYMTGEEVLQQMQRVINHWEGGLRATGSAKDPQKTIGTILTGCGIGANGITPHNSISREI
jgi:hypothetical protein